MYISRIHQHKDAEDSCLHGFDLKLFTVKETHKIILTETCKFWASHWRHLHCSADIKVYFKDYCVRSHPRTNTLGRHCCKSWPSGVGYIIFFPPFWLYINHFLIILFFFYQTTYHCMSQWCLECLWYLRTIFSYFQADVLIVRFCKLTERLFWQLIQFSPAADTWESHKLFRDMQIIE